MAAAIATIPKRHITHIAGMKAAPRHGALLQTLGERQAGEVLHHKEHRALVIADVVERADVGMVQAGDGLRLALEARAALGVGADISRKDFDDDGAI